MAIDFVPEIDYTARDYTAIKNALTQHVQTHFPDDHSDFLESSPAMMLLELVAFVGDQLHLYLDNQANEAFMPTVRQRANAINLAALVGYVPRSTAAASAPIKMTLDTAQVEDTVVDAFTRFLDNDGSDWEFLTNTEIPAGRTDTTGISVTGEVLGQGNGTSATFTFVTANSNIKSGASTQLAVTISTVTYTLSFRADGTISLPFGGSGILDFSTGQLTLNFVAGNVPDNATNITITYTYNQNIIAFQGRTRSEQFNSDGTLNQEFVLSQTPVLVSPTVEDQIIVPNPNRFEVWVGDPGAPFGNATGTLFSRVESLVNAAATENVYEISFDDQDRLIITFGDGITGAIPSSGSTITVIYRTGGGIKGNVATGQLNTSVTGTAGLLAVTVNVENIEKASGGAERESLDEIRINAPAFARTNATITTEQDFTDSSRAFSRSGLGAIARASARLEPPLVLTTKTIHTQELLATVPATPPIEFFVLLPATPAVVSTIQVSYVVGGIPFTATASDLGAGLADLTGTNIDNVSTRLRYDEQDFIDKTIAGFVGDGSTTAFGPGILTNAFPVLPSSMSVKYTIGGTEFVAFDDGGGNIVGTNISSGSIAYETGSVSLTFSSAPDDGQAVLFSFSSAARLVFTAAPDGGSEITISMESGPSSKTFPTNNVQVYTWSFDGGGNLVVPSSSLRDQLKARLDLNRVIGVSIEVLAGFNIKVSPHLTVEFEPAVDQTETINRIIDALSDFFSQDVNVDAGDDLVLAAMYNAVFPIFGAKKATIQDVGVTVPFGKGDGTTTIFRDDVRTPGRFVPTGKLPAVSGANQVKVLVNNVEVGASDAATPQAGLSGTGVGSGSFFNVNTGDFEIRLSPAPQISDSLDLSFFLDETDTTLQIDLWNVRIEEWEIAVLGEIVINGTKVN